MTKYREILRLLSNKLKTDEIVHACNVSKKTIIKGVKDLEEFPQQCIENHTRSNLRFTFIFSYHIPRSTLPVSGIGVQAPQV